MRLKNFTAVSALVIAAMGVTAGTVNAAPAADNNGAINYAVTTTDTNTVLRTDAGSLVADNGKLEIKATNGTVVASMPLSFRVDDFEFPIAAEIADHTATLTPQFDMDHATYKPVAEAKDVALPYEDQAPWKSDYDREQAAWNRMKDTVSLGATVATLVGGLGGAALGCVAGIGVGLVATGALATLFGLGPIGGCIAGAAAVGFLGTIAGQLFITAPVSIAAAIQYFTTINQPHIAPAPAK
ncbi:hypothetical protein ACFYUD_23770 [Nocardia tengchongensis]|uniref:DUF8020 domain-containing protein n=1 Tax=Nocardia tengchongensis TaxID=2055889 RepID=A0ABX8CS98_9NOCA|nr:hypothetical protein [Nocardia tengchongensis]QVI22776.1 hypothetical protein KHQ06_07220 [Nocardia tengchongensis]